MKNAFRRYTQDIAGHGSIELSVANIDFAVAVSLYLLGIWFSQERIIAKGDLQSYFMLAVAAGVLVLERLPHTIATTGLLIVANVIYRQYRPLQTKGIHE